MQPSSIPGLGRSPGEGNGNPLQYSCLENSMQRSLVSYSPQSPKELDTTGWLTLSLGEVLPSREKGQGLLPFTDGSPVSWDGDDLTWGEVVIALWAWGGSPFLGDGLILSPKLQVEESHSDDGVCPLEGLLSGFGGWDLETHPMGWGVSHLSPGRLEYCPLWGWLLRISL